MGRTAKPRKQYRPHPRGVMSDPLTLLRPASRQAAGAVMLRFLTAIEQIARGRSATQAEWRDLSDAINTVETLALHMGRLDPAEVMPVVNAAIRGMVLASERFRDGKGMRFDAQGLEAVRAVVDIYGQCLERLTEREMALAQQETARRVAEMLRRPTAGAVAL